MGKARSFRLTPQNETRLEELIKRSDLDNANQVFNHVIENYYLFEKYQDLVLALDKHFNARRQ